MGTPTVLFAATTTTLEKLEKIPPAFWLKVGIAVVGIIVVVIALRKLLQVNKVVVGAVLFIGGGLLFFNWIYYRTEPKALTPLFNRIAPFFPSAGAYDAKQATTPDQAKK
jgi:drug/metabolite transporter (DMT)-like permease